MSMTSTLATVKVAGSSHGGIFRYGQPRIIVVHSVECPIRRDQAAFRMGLLAARTDASGHYVVDPSTVAAGVDESLVAWGAGSVNPAAIHVEFCGYAAYTRAQWTTDDGLAMLKLGGKLIADIAKRRGIPVRWLTDAQLLAAWKGQGPGGLTTHAQCTRVIGGTTHYDPGSGFPTDLLLGYASPAPTQTAPTDDLETDMQVTFTDAYKYDQAIKAGKSDAQARDLATVTYSTTDKALAGILSYMSSILRDVQAIKAGAK